MEYVAVYLTTFLMDDFRYPVHHLKVWETFARSCAHDEHFHCRFESAEGCSRALPVGRRGRGGAYRGRGPLGEYRALLGATLLES